MGRRGRRRCREAQGRGLLMAKADYSPAAYARRLAYARRQYELFPEKIRERVRRSMAKAYAANPEKFRRRSSEEQKRRYAADPSKFAAKGAARRALVATPAWAKDEFNDFVVGEMYSLARQRTKATGIKWVVDHIVPLQSKLVCGLHWWKNLRVIPDSLNKSKGNRLWPDHPDPLYQLKVSETFL
jgi:5-methylcytosine-specific restriction endonuclease McrA